MAYAKMPSQGFHVNDVLSKRFRTDRSQYCRSCAMRRVGGAEAAGGGIPSKTFAGKSKLRTQHYIILDSTRIYYDIL